LIQRYLKHNQDDKKPEDANEIEEKEEILDLTKRKTTG